MTPATQAQEVSPTVVISQVYGGGGNSGAPYTHDFIELYNRGTAPVNLRGWSLQYASASGTFTQVNRFLADVILAPGQYLVVQEGTVTNPSGQPLSQPLFPGIPPISMSASAAKVALVRSTTALGCSTCTPVQLANVVDLVGYGNDSNLPNLFEGTGPALGASNTMAVLRRNDGETDTNDNAADFVAGPPSPHNTGLTIGDVTIVEGDDTNSIATFTISLGSPSLLPVTFSVKTVNGAATAGEDFHELLPTQLAINPGQRTVTVDVTILGDTTIEADETFQVVLVNASGAGVSDDVAIGTIQNDDLPFYAIHEIQGPGAASPHVSETVATSGIVTGLKSNGFFIQAPDAEVDTLTETSEGVFVFLGSAAAVAIGDAVKVTGRVAEFRGGSAVLPSTLTEIAGTVGVKVLSSGNALPASVDAATFNTHASNRTEQLEHLEGMLVHAASMTAVDGTSRFGEFYAVMTGTARPFREPGVDVSDVLPPSVPGGLQTFDGNFERILVDSDESFQGGARRAALVVSAGAVVTPVAGPLDYAFDTYRINLAGEPSVTPGIDVAAVPVQTAGELTVGALNLENFYPPTTSATSIAAFEGRLQKASLVIRTVLRTPDILGLIEVGDLDVLTQLAQRVNADAGTSYVPYLLEGNDSGGNDQDVGYLVNSARVETLQAPYQEYRGVEFPFCGDSDLLFDRPPFVLKAAFDGMPVTVVLNHLKSLIEVNSNDPYVPQLGGPCSGTIGERNRLKRQLGAEYLADLVEALQNENLIVLGDMNAFEFNDGYVDVIGTIAGSPAPADQVIAPSTDRWDHTLADLVTTLPADQRYSYVFDGNAQVLDHVLVNARMLQRLTRFAYARVNADFSELLSADATRPDRFSDHDGPVAYFTPVADLTTTTNVPDLVTSGTAFSYSVVVSNVGLDRADDVVVTATLPTGTEFDTVSAPEGWTCTSTAGQVACAAAALDGNASATFTIHARAQCGLANGAILNAATTVTSPDDSVATNNGSSDTGAVSNPAPVISGISVDKPMLWPVNHKMQDVRVAYAIADNCGPVTTSLSVSSNEPTGAEADWQVVDGHLIRLRAERSGGGSGRTYTVTITATDSAGNASSGKAIVTVPHNR